MRALLIALAVVVAWAGFQTIRAGRLKAEAVALRAENATLEREAVGQAEISTAVERHYSRETIIREGTSEAIAQARSAPDAATPLDPMRADRLRAADGLLCQQVGLASCADADPASGRAHAVPDPDAS